MMLWLAAAPVETRSLHVGAATFIERAEPTQTISTTSKHVLLESTPRGALVTGVTEGSARVVVSEGARVVRTIVVKVEPPRLTEAQLGHALRCARSKARIVVTQAPHFELRGALEPNLDPRVREAVDGVWTRDLVVPGPRPADLLQSIVTELEAWTDGSAHLEVEVDDAGRVVLSGAARHQRDVARVEALRQRFGFSFAVDVRLLDATPCAGDDAG